MNGARPERGVWRVRRPQEVRLRRFDAEALAFNPLTCETHLLTGQAVHVLARLLVSPASVEELVRTVTSPAYGDPAPDVHLESVSRILAELRDFGLVVQVPEVSDETARP